MLPRPNLLHSLFLIPSATEAARASCSRPYPTISRSVIRNATRDCRVSRNLQPYRCIHINLYGFHTYHNEALVIIFINSLELVPPIRCSKWGCWCTSPEAYTPPSRAPEALCVCCRGAGLRPPLVGTGSGGGRPHRVPRQGTGERIHERTKIKRK